MRTPHVAAGIFLVCGTSIGTGILGIPMSTAETGFMYSTIAFLLCWIFTTIASLYLLEANLWIKNDTSLSSMAKILLGTPGKNTIWLLNLILLYALLCLYLLAGSSWLSLFAKHSLNIEITTNSSLLGVLTVAIIIVFFGMALIDKLNRFMTVIFLSSLFLLVFQTSTKVSPVNLKVKNTTQFCSTLPILITSFGYSVIIPSLTNYMKYDLRKILKSIFIGSILTLIAYILWEIVTLGSIPLGGQGGLLELASQHDDGTGIIRGLITINGENISVFINGFTIGIITTSFFGVSMALYHFLKDGFSLNNTVRDKVINILMMYGPPTAALLLFPSGFHNVLSWAGAIVAFYLGIIPVIMVWKGRYVLQYQGFKVPGGKMALILTFGFFSLVIMQKVFEVI